jgi:hypothetical protein
MSIHRFRHLLGEDDDNIQITVEETAEKTQPTIPLHKFKEALESRKKKRDFGSGNGFDDGDDDDGDDDFDGDDEEEYLQDKLDVAGDAESFITEARVIFQRCPKTGKVLMIARLDDLDLEEDDLEDDEMWKADLIIRTFGDGFGGSKKDIPGINSSIFKKKNWDERIS